MNYAKWALAACMVLLVCVLAFYKPVRVLFPEAFGVSCGEQGVCVDDPAQREPAMALLNAAAQGLEARYGVSVRAPKIIFCASVQCGERFGLSRRAGFTLGALGIVIAPRGWEEHYVAHELVHYWQAENFGSLVLVKGEPWLIEGMAYALSSDPREALHEPFESYRRRFSDWHARNAGVPLAISLGELL